MTDLRRTGDPSGTMESQYIWWVVALVLGIAEMLTGTLYMLVLALGCVAGGAAAAAGGPIWSQCLAAGVVSLLGTAWARRMRTGRPSGQPVGRNRDVHADVGERVQVDQWDAQGRARVQYRGTQWDAQWDPVDRALYDATPETDRPAASEFVIRALDGNSLILARRLPDTPRP